MKIIEPKTPKDNTFSLDSVNFGSVIRCSVPGRPLGSVDGGAYYILTNGNGDGDVKQATLVDLATGNIIDDVPWSTRAFVINAKLVIES
jgi:hypothetical protein